jgi:hypothetical protein
MPVPDLSTQKKLPVNTKIGNDGSISGLWVLCVIPLLIRWNLNNDIRCSTCEFFFSACHLLSTAT